MDTFSLILFLSIKKWRERGSKICDVNHERVRANFIVRYSLGDLRLKHKNEMSNEEMSELSVLRLRHKN